MGCCYMFVGLLFCLTIIGLPFGYQLMKIGLYTFFPFGKSPTFGAKAPGCLSIIFNVVWIICGWFELALAHCIIGLLLCLTIIGIPFGMQHFKIARLTFMPFGQSL